MDLSTHPANVGNTQAEPPAIDLKWLHPDLIAASLTNPRKSFDDDKLNELASSLLDGQVQPIVVRYLPGSRVADTFANRGDGKPLPVYELVVGERRWRAAQLINLARDEARQKPGNQYLQSFELRAEVRAMTDLEVIRTQIVENLHREEVHPLEEAEGYDYLLHHSAEGITVDQVADEVGKSRRYVFARMQLLRLCPEARDAFRAGKLDASTALLVASVPTPGLQIKALDELARQATALRVDKPSFRNAKRLLQQRFHLGLASVTWDLADTTLLPSAGACSTCPKRTGNQPELFDDETPADTCTDPDCFEAKRIAQVQATVAAARKAGQNIIEGDEAAKAMPYGPDHTYSLKHNGLRALDDVAYIDDETTHTFADLLQRMAEAGARKKIKPSLIIHPDHPEAMPTQVISNEAAQQLLDKFAPKPKPRELTPEQLARRRANEEHLLQARVRNRLEKTLTDHLLQASDKPRTHADLVGMLFALSGCGSYDLGADTLAELSNFDEATWKDFDDDSVAMAYLSNHLMQQDAQTLSRIAMCLMVSSSSLPDCVLSLMAQSHGLDVASERTRIEAEVLREQNNQAGAAGGSADAAGDDDA